MGLKPKRWYSTIPDRGNHKQSMGNDLKSMSLEELQEVVCGLGGKKFHAKYIFSFIHAKLVKNIDELTTLGKSLRKSLGEEGYFIAELRLVEKFADPDSTIKYLFEVSSGERFETVLLKDNGRKTLCISCQCGCKMGCVFCATAKIKFSRNLSAGEIVSQVYEVIDDIGPINNVVFMGMGEPFDNYESVIRAARLLNDEQGQNIGARHQTISTCGFPERIVDLANEDLQCRLAVSIHAGCDETRNKVMPVNKKWPMKNLLDAVRAYQKITKRRITFEYCMIKGINDSVEECESLMKNIRGIKCNINLIEYNPHDGCKFEPSNEETIKSFQEKLVRAGFETHVRFKRGQKIKAACGQLGAGWLEKNEK